MEINQWIGVIGILLIITAVLGQSGCWAYTFFVVYPEYNRQVHSHIDNAFEVNTPEAMKQELLLAEQGMKNLGLTSDKYGSLMPWEQMPSNQMKFQYEFIDGVIERVDSVIAWKTEMYKTNNTQIENLGDVYEQKMDNLREFIFENGSSDWIAKNAWLANNYTLLYYSWILWLVMIGIGGLLFVVGVISQT